MQNEFHIAETCLTLLNMINIYFYINIQYHTNMKNETVAKNE